MRQQKWEGGIKPKRNRRTRDAQHSCSPPTDQCPPHPSAAPDYLLSVYIPRMTFCCMEYPLGQFGSAVPDMLPPSFLLISSLPENGKLKSPWFGVSTAEEIPKHQCIVNIILRLNKKKTTVPYSRNKIIPLETGTERWQGETWGPQSLFFYFGFTDKSPGATS